MALRTAPIGSARFTHPNTHPDCVPIIHNSAELKIMVVGAAGFEPALPGPETDAPRYLLEYKANIFARNFI
jgi:hypothetical protein